jgi:hypothetical protein
MSVEAGQDQEGRRSEDESKRDGKRKEEERTYVSETVLNVFLAPCQLVQISRLKQLA